MADLPEFRWDSPRQWSTDSIRIDPHGELPSVGLQIEFETDSWNGITVDHAGVERLRDYLTTWLEATRV